jgi:hypothetical protein
VDNKVVLYHNNETGQWYWSIIDAHDNKKWLKSFDTKENAIEYCKLHELEIVRVIDDEEA